MTLDYTRTWEVMNELEMVTSKICSAREILDSAINALESGNKEKAETLMYAADEFLQYYLEDFDRKFKTAWSETVVKLKEEDPCMPPWGHSDLEYGLSNNLLTQDRVSNFPGDQYTDEELNAMCDKAEQDQITFSNIENLSEDFWSFDNMNYPYSGYNTDTITFNNPEKKNKVKKWILPVQEMENGDTMENEYFIQLPDDLLEQAGWKENDELNWVDNKDGTFTLTKTNG
jgi:hypothetical protein